MVRDVVREMEQTKRHKEESTVTVYRATPEQIDKMLGGKQMSRPVGSKNKSKIKNSTDQHAVVKQEVKENATEVVKAEDQGELEPPKVKIDEVQAPRALNHMDEFRKAIQTRYRNGCIYEFVSAVEEELKSTGYIEFEITIKKIMDYCEETLKQIKKDF